METIDYSKPMLLEDASPSHSNEKTPMLSCLRILFNYDVALKAIIPHVQEMVGYENPYFSDALYDTESKIEIVGALIDLIEQDARVAQACEVYIKKLEDYLSFHIYNHSERILDINPFFEEEEAMKIAIQESFYPGTLFGDRLKVFVKTIKNAVLLPFGLSQ